MRRIISSLLITGPACAFSSSHTWAGSRSLNGLRKDGRADELSDFNEVIGDPDGKGGEFSG